MKGNYIVLEGIVGCGKTTQAKKLYEYLKNKYPEREIILTREPGGSEIAEHIRTVVQGTVFSESMTPECEAYLYAAARAQTLRSIVLPVIQRGGIVITDRSFLSSAAFQGAGRGLKTTTILEINKHAVPIIPDQILFLDVDPTVGLERSFDKKGDKFEQENVAFFKRVREGYREIGTLSPFQERWKTINAAGSVEEVFAEITKALMLLSP